MTDLNPIDSIPDALALACLPEVAAREHCWLPYHLERPRKKLHVACVRPPGRQLTQQITDTVNQQTRSNGDWLIQWNPLPSKSKLIGAINTAYEGSFDVEEITRQYHESVVNGAQNLGDDQWPVGRWFDALMNDAVHRRASDIHLLPSEGLVSVRYRVDGYMVDRMDLPLTMWSSLLSRLKVLSALDVSEHRRPQEGAFERCVHGKPQPVRSAFMPHALSEKVTLRLLRSAAELPRLQDLLVVPTQYEIIASALKKRQGLLVVAGATGSGKTTTLYGCLKHWLNEGLNLITLEDPIEVSLPGVCQSEINAAIGYSFSAGLRAALRHDPDGLMVGEIRDSETCVLALRSAITGHPVVASVHANNAVGVFQRLISMGATLTDLQQCVHTVIVQRLARSRCSCVKDHANLGHGFDGNSVAHSSENTGTSSGAIVNLNANANANASTCLRCYGAGYSGVVAVLEVFQPSAEFFNNPLQWAREQQKVDEQYQLTLQQMHAKQHIDVYERDRLANHKGGKDATVSS